MFFGGGASRSTLRNGLLHYGTNMTDAALDTAAVTDLHRDAGYPFGREIARRCSSAISPMPSLSREFVIEDQTIPAL